MPVLGKKIEMDLLPWMRLDDVFIQTHSQAWSLGQRKVPIVDRGKSRSGILDISFREIVEMFLYFEVWRAGGQLHSGRRGNRTAYVVGGYQNVIRLRPPRQFPGIQ